MPLRFLIVDGYPAESRQQFRDVGMRWAGELYRDLLLKHLPDAEVDLWFSSDPGVTAPDEGTLQQYAGVLWPGCNLTVYHDDPRVHAHLDLCRRVFEQGTPQFGSCWALQLAATVAGGTVAVNPKGREMGVKGKIRLTEQGRRHPMFEGKPEVYSHFMSHDDEVQTLPEGAVRLAGNDWSDIQAADVKHAKGHFWAVQYHPEYDLHELARLILARQDKLMKYGYFKDAEDVARYVEKLEALHAEPGRKDLRWQLQIDDDVIDDNLRELEFKNWLRHQVLQGELPANSEP